MVTTTVGVAGHPWRADVTTWGAIVPWDASPPLDWCIAADDRWHLPERETAVRQVRVGGTPVIETRVRIPRGDALHRTWTVADGGGHTVVEVHNESSLPIAVAFSRPDLRTSRPPADVPIHGIDLPAASTIVLPIGHHGAVRVALAHDGSGRGPLPEGLSSHAAVARGWRAGADRASILELPDQLRVEAVVAARCDVTLGGPPDRDVDPIGFVLGAVELVRMGEPVGPWVADVAAAAGEGARRHAGWDVDAALAAAAALFARARERRALGDVTAIARSRMATAGPEELPDGIRVVAAVERHLTLDGVVLPDGLPPAWHGVGFECHGVPAGAASTISFAVRWHGDRPAVLWEVEGPPIELTAPAIDPSWRTTEPRGEALWPPVTWPA